MAVPSKFRVARVSARGRGARKVPGPRRAASVSPGCVRMLAPRISLQQSAGLSTRALGADTTATRGGERDPNNA